MLLIDNIMTKSCKYQFTSSANHFKDIEFHFILFYFILFYFILFYVNPSIYQINISDAHLYVYTHAID